MGVFWISLQADKFLVMGSRGLIGLEAVDHFDRQGPRSFRRDNNMRRLFSAPAGDTLV